MSHETITVALGIPKWYHETISRFADLQDETIEELILREIQTCLLSEIDELKSDPGQGGSPEAEGIRLVK